jgi:hypothetical protein
MAAQEPKTEGGKQKLDKSEKILILLRKPMIKNVIMRIWRR